MQMPPHHMMPTWTDVCLLLAIFSCPVFTTTIGDASFSKAPISSLHGGSGKISLFMSVSRVLMCASGCQKNNDCVSFLYDESQQNCLLVGIGQSYASLPANLAGWQLYLRNFECAYTYVPQYATCVRFYSSTGSSKSWTAARSSCQEQGGDLLDMEGTAKFAYFRNIFKNQYSGKDFHIRARKVSGTFQWLRSGSALISNEWGPGQPDNHLGNEECVGAQVYSDYYLNDIPCDGTLTGYYACEY